MSTERPRNMAASVNARLLQLTRQRKEDFQLVLTRYANERLLYRLSMSAYTQNFVLKGATVYIPATRNRTAFRSSHCPHVGVLR